MPILQSHKEKRVMDHAVMPEMSMGRWGLRTTPAGGGAGKLQMFSCVFSETLCPQVGGSGMKWNPLLVFLQFYD